MKNSQPFPPDSILAKRYQIIRELASNPGNRVYQARDLQSGSQVRALVISLSQIKKWQRLDLFNRNKEIIRTLKHKNIPRFLDDFEVELNSERYFIQIYEYIEGQSLSELIEKNHSFTFKEIQRITENLFDILEYMHNLYPPKIHRGVHPANIFIGTSGQAYLTNFSYTSAFSESVDISESQTLYTHPYQAPEEQHGRFLPQTDIFSLGMSLASIFTGESNLKASKPNIRKNLPKILSSQPSVSEKLQKLLVSMTEEKIENRPKSIARVRKTWKRNFIHRTESTASTFSDQRKKIPNLILRPAILIAATVILLSVGITTFVYRKVNDSREILKQTHQQTTAALNPKKLSSPDQGNFQLENKLNLCMTRHSSRIHMSIDRYAQWVDLKKGISGKERTVYGLYSIYSPNGYFCRRTESEKNDNNLSLLMSQYIEKVRELKQYIDSVQDYYNNEYYLDDKFAKGKKMHKPLLCKFKQYFQVEQKIFHQLKSAASFIEEAIPEKKDTLPVWNEALRVAFLSRHLWLSMTAMLSDQGAAKKRPQIVVNKEFRSGIEKLQNSINFYEKNLRELKEKIQNNPENRDIQIYKRLEKNSARFSKHLRGFARELKPVLLKQKNIDRKNKYSNRALYYHLKSSINSGFYAMESITREINNLSAFKNNLLPALYPLEKSQSGNVKDILAMDCVETD